MGLGVDNIICVDETGVESSYYRQYGRSRVGMRIEGVKHGKRLRRTNVIAGLWGRKHIAIQCYEHATTARFFEDWFEFELLAVIPEKSLVIMDNASFHRKKSLYKIAKLRGYHLLFLPPYTPELNHIEKSWANLKRWLCDNLKRFPCLDFALDCFFSR
jgi:hypothetical protein